MNIKFNFQFITVWNLVVRISLVLDNTKLVVAGNIPNPESKVRASLHIHELIPRADIIAAGEDQCKFGSVFMADIINVTFLSQIIIQQGVIELKYGGS